MRSAAFVVSALSDIAANGRQAQHRSSSDLSGIPHAGSSPDRLQTRFRPRPTSPCVAAPLRGRECSRLLPRRWSRSRITVQAAPRVSDVHRGSSGPWLPGRFSGPARSALTRATSAPRQTTRLLGPIAGPSRQSQRAPNSLWQSPHPVPSPVSRVIPATAWDDAVIAGAAFSQSPRARRSLHPLRPSLTGQRHEAAVVVSCCGLGVFLTQLRPGLSRPSSHRSGRPVPRRL